MKINFHLYLLSYFLFFSFCVNAQQQTFNSPLSPLDFALNPAMTAPGELMEAGAFYRQQWAGFKNAPRTAMIYGQYPLVYNNISIGGYLLHDETGFIDSDEIGITTSYKLKIGLSSRDQLSVGLSAIAKQLRYDDTNAIANSNTDPSLNAGQLNAGSINFGGGFFYTTDKDMYYNEGNAFYFGASATQLVSQNNDTSDAGRFNQRLHATGALGGRFITNYIIIEPSAWVSYAMNSPIDVIGSFKIEYEDTCWAGLSYQTGKTESTLYLQLGYIQKAGNGFLKIGISGNLGLGQTRQARGGGYEFLVAYQLGV